MLKKYKGYIIMFYILSAVSLITASFVDLRLDIMLNNPHDPFSKWFEATGEMPCRLVGVIAGVLIFYLCDKPLTKLFGIIVNLGCAAYLGYHISRYFFVEENRLLFGLLFGIGIGVTALYFGKFIAVPDEYRNALIILSFTGIIVMFVQLGCIEIIKMLWGRVRFRDIVNLPNYDGFTAWYHPNGYNGNRSFPSGHTAGAAMSYMLMLLPYISEKQEKRRFAYFAVPFAFTSIVAFTRLVMGAHYLSDVTMGGVIGFTTVIIAMTVLEKKFFVKKFISIDH